MSSIHIYWDESHFWGLLVTRALTAWGIPHRLVRGHEIADGVLSGKSGPRPELLIVPGGRAKGKTDRLGLKGMDAVCEYVHSGGTYLGFCGGTGLGLTGPYSLGLSPWTRQGYKNRLHHFLSGHVTSDLAADPLVPEGLGGEAMLPVWWPGRFAPSDNGVTVLARYRVPGPDFWVADLHLASLPKGTMTDWENLYGIHLRPDFLEGLPCVTRNEFGAGRVILSYAHLETPASPPANRWLGHILSTVLGETVGEIPVPAWDVAARPVRWDDPVLASARAAMEETVATGLSHFLLFWRTPWLLGWRRGIPGAGINSLYSLICEAMAREPDDAALAFWKRRRDQFAVLMKLLAGGLSGYLLAERLAMTVFHSDPEAVSQAGLLEQRRALFGRPPEPGGIHADLAAMLEELYWLLSLSNNNSH
ncbi:biotin--protein ligase [Pseudodesulfovibrio cashew]|uniref:Biotin--protein ligase n=1 Tax=Pseudodesulfovibrio cashew TaxID=2678688 RepID=A0A6I6JIB8_9BACT|nr:BPL-N domain-containing protein [Pseudodesulfovibrio cashew]QGY40052.1 biotin--protein ligase [Pseudodesulfovibrio cashew]